MNFIITDFVQALNTSHSSPFNVFTTEDLDWSFWHIIQIIILSYLKFLTVYVSMSFKSLEQCMHFYHI